MGEKGELPLYEQDQVKLNKSKYSRAFLSFYALSLLVCGALLYLSFTTSINWAKLSTIKFPFSPSSSTCAITLPEIPPNGMYRAHRACTIQEIAKTKPKDNSLIFLVGNKQEYRSNSDTGILFRQDSSFLYLSGFNTPDASIAIDLVTEYSILFLRRKSSSELTFDGGYPDFEELKRDYEVDQVEYVDEADTIIESRYPNLQRIYTSNKDTLLQEVPEFDQYQIDVNLLPPVSVCRQIKTDQEVEMIRTSTSVSSKAHEIIIANTEPGWYESDIESLFLAECYNCGLRFQSYVPIVATGKNGHILHYIKNNEEVKNGDIILVDAAGEFKGYTSDITRTYPANGIFTADQRMIYQIVLNAQEAAIARCAPGVTWSQVNTVATETLVKGLLNANIFIGSLNELLSAGVLSTFMPHGLGHPVGLDVHDPTPFPSYILTKNHIFTIEPGIYFNERLLDQVRNDPNKSKYFNWQKIDALLDFGGVRIEDVILITDSGHEILSTVPKQIDEIERLMQKSLIRFGH